MKRHRESWGGRMARAIGALLACLCFAPPALGADDELRLVVLLVRHGVRTPLATKPPMSDFAAEPWPSYPDLAPGDLTPRGRELARLVGAWQHAWYGGEARLFPRRGCPARDLVFFWSDSEERDLETSKGLLDGLVPGCDVPIRHVDEPHDPLFHPEKTGLCAPDPAAVEASVLARIGSFADAVEAYRAPLERIDTALGCCQAPACEEASLDAPCTLLELPGGVTRKGSLRGALGVGSTVAEDFLLQFADGLPAEQVGWGRVSREDLEAMLPIHALELDLTLRSPASARALASNLAAQILATLEQGASGRPVPGALAPATSRFVAFVGHDTNLAGVGGLLGLAWELPTLPPNATPPAGALVFELRRAKGGAASVRAAFVAQTLDQMRDATPLSAASPPARAEIAIPGCAGASGGAGCPLPDFAKQVRAAVDADCVSEPLRAFSRGAGP